MNHDQLRDMLRERKRKSGTGEQAGWDELCVVYEDKHGYDGESHVMGYSILEIGDHGLSLRCGYYVHYDRILRVEEDVAITLWGKPAKHCEVSPRVAEGVRYVIERSQSLALDDEGDRESLIEVLVPELLSFIFTGEPGNAP